jgi:hypothetical protein
MPLSRLGAGAGVIALATSGLFGGLDQVEAEKTPTVAVNAVNKGVPWNVTVYGMRVVDKLEPLRLENPGDRWIAVLAIVEVTADESRNDLDDAIRIPGVPGLLAAKKPGSVKGEADQVALLRDDTVGPTLNPGMPEKIAYIWEQDGSAEVPAKATVTIRGKTLRKDSLTGHEEWLDTATRATVPDVPVEDKRKPT